MESRHPHDIGMIGLGVMGRNLAMNMADHGFSVAGYDNDRLKVEALREETAGRDISAADTIPDFISLLRRPRAIMMLVPAGAPVDSVVRDVLPHLHKGDLIIDGGNSFFKVLADLKDLRKVVCQAGELEVPASGLMVSLGYCDAYRSAWLPANLIQAQRDYFGAHTYERIDGEGTFHTEWEKK